MLVRLFAIFLICIAFSNASTIGGRVINGINAESQHDFTVRIHSVVDEAASSAYLSSGFAISSRMVITVAQAIHSYSIWYVFSGGVITATQIFHESRSGVSHPDYNPTNLNNNIGLIVFSADPFLNHIAAAIPGASIGAYQVFGYGFIAGNQLPTVLQTIAVSSITNEECARLYGSALITERNFCGVPAQSNTQVANGDQGGPLIPLFFEPVAAGIVSFWGTNATLPIVFERVHAYYDFILENWS